MNITTHSSYYSYGQRYLNFINTKLSQSCILDRSLYRKIIWFSASPNCISIVPSLHRLQKLLTYKFLPIFTHLNIIIVVSCLSQVGTCKAILFSCFIVVATILYYTFYMFLKCILYKLFELSPCVCCSFLQNPATYWE